MTKISPPKAASVIEWSNRSIHTVYDNFVFNFNTFEFILLAMSAFSTPPLAYYTSVEIAIVITIL